MITSMEQLVSIFSLSLTEMIAYLIPFCTTSQTIEKCGKESHSGEHMEPSPKQVDTDEPAARKPQVSNEGS